MSISSLMSVEVKTGTSLADNAATDSLSNYNVNKIKSCTSCS